MRGFGGVDGCGASEICPNHPHLSKNHQYIIMTVGFRIADACDGRVVSEYTWLLNPKP